MSFIIKPAFRDNTPLYIGLVGPSGGGKTMSAHRLAVGIQRVRGGEIVGVDTEGNRMLYYAPRNGETPDFKQTFDFEHLPFGEPFSSLRYAEAIREAAKFAKGGIIIVDSMSHEHDGIGGYLDYHNKECERYSKGEGKTSEAVSWRAFAKPAADRRILINTMTQFNIALILCFKAKEKSMMIKDPADGKNKVVPIGFQALSGDEFVYEMPLRCLLVNGADGVPDWSAEAFKNGVARCPEMLKPIMLNKRQLDEQHGEELAMWAAGRLSANTAVSEKKSRNSPSHPANSGDNGHISLFPADWEAVRAKIEKKIESTWKDLKEDTLGILAEGKNENHRNFAINELRYRIVKFGELYASANQDDDFNRTIGDDIALIPEKELAVVAKQLRNGWKKLADKK